MSRSSYKVRAIRDDGWWSLIADVGTREVASQSRRLDTAGPMIREAIALALDIDEDAFDVQIHPELPAGDVARLAREAIELREEYEATGQKLSRATARAVRVLRKRGYSVRDIAHLIGITPGRVSQIEHGRR
jgi:DNA-directed RNA polymerase specialized sigma24 family protein